MRLIGSSAVHTGFVLLTLAIVLAGDAWRYTVGWWAFGTVAALLGVWSIVLLVVRRGEWRLSGLPIPLVAFLVLATASLAWSHYPGATALGLLTTWLLALAAVAIGLTTRWDDLLRALGHVLRAILALSLVFELVVATIIRRPILPLFTQPGVDYSDYETIPRMLYWSRNELFEVFDEGRIQGIVGNANHLGFLALLGLIVFTLQLADRRVRRITGIGWIALAVLTLVFTRSATVTLALVGVIVLAGAALLVRRTVPGRPRAVVYAVIAAVLAVGATAAVLLRGTLLGLLGKSEDLTGRLGIWEKVIDLAQQRPVVGWGWVSYWVPWADPFTDLAFRNGVRQLQAHNAWLDLWLQLGIVGVIVFGALVASAFLRSWTLAVDRPMAHPGETAPFRATLLLPLLVLGALLVQSAAESRLLVEFGLFLLVLVAVKTKRQDDARVI